jgi:hypothetical protein
MILGMSPLTFVHVLLSLIGIAAGFVVAFGLMAAKPLSSWTALFLSTTVLTSATGFLLPASHFMPSHAIGILSLVVLAIAIFARYARHLSGGWRRTYVITAMISQYLNVFVLVAQLFMKVPALKAMAPTGSEPPFLVSQVTVMIFFIILTILAAKKFHGPIAQTA